MEKFEPHTTMKSKLRLQTSAAVCVLLISLAMAPAQPGAPAGAFPSTPGSPQLDPSTGLPIATMQWVDPSWSDPDIILTNVMYDNLPLSEVANQLRERFKDHFDILPMPKTFGTDWGNTTIQLQLKNVKASDVFNAMNMVFENDQTPLRWELKQTGNRQVVLLHVMPEAMPGVPPPAQPPEIHRMVYFIGNLVGDEKSGGMTMDQIVSAILEAWPADFGKSDGVIQFHTQTQMLVVNGTRDQNDFVQQILSALARKADWERMKQRPATTSPKSSESKSGTTTPGGGGSN
jgi:hypothetical protein